MSGLVFDATDLARVSTTQRVQPNVRLALSVLLVCAGYYIGALTGKSLRFPSSNLALIWPPTAVLLAGLLLARRRTWWIYLLAAAPVHILVQTQDAVPVWGIMSLLIGNFGQALMAAFSVRYFNKEAPLFNNFRAVVVFMVGAVILAPGAVSSIAAYLYVLSGWEQNYWYAWRARVLSNALSTLMIVPPIILLATRGATAKTAFARPQRYIEAGLLLVAFVLTGWISFSKTGEALFGMACPIIMPLPVLLWSAVRFGPEGLCLSILLVAYFAFIQATGGHGFFAMDSAAQNVLSLQFYLILTALPLMLLAVLIEERREKEDALRESEARYRALVMTSAETVWRADARGEGFLATAAWQHLTGQSEEEVRDFGWLEAVHPSDRERSRRLWEQAMNGRHAYENELRVRTRDGDWRYFHVHAVPILAPDRSVHQWVGASTDITERKRAEVALRDSEERYRAVVEHQTELVCRFLPDTTLTFVNPAYARYFGKSAEELVGQSFLPLIPEDQRKLARAFFRSLIQHPRIGSQEHKVFTTTGEIRWHHWVNRPVLDSDGRVVEFQGVGRDVTDRKRAECRLNTQYAVTRVLADSISLANAAPRILQSICECLECEFGEIWQVNRQTNVLTCVEKWHLPVTLLTEFASAGQLTFPFGVGLPGRVWESREAFCIPDIAVDPNFPRASAAITAGLRGALGFPILLSDETVGVIVLFTREVREAEKDLLQMMTSIGSQVGQFIERKRAEDALKAALDEVRRLKERLELENVYLRSEVMGVHRYGEIIGESEGIRKVLEEVGRVGGTDMTVLVLGETGTGKELVARLVHEKSGRRERPLVKVNCSALPAELIESELFGHERGAFTGAVAKQVGRFELADGGTIFLDEVGELPLRLQSKLLTVLQEGEFERLGSGKTVKVDVRVIAATNRNLSEAVQRGRFRADLYYRLNVYPIEIPPLREHREDIGLLAEAFLQEAGRRLGKGFGKIPDEVIETLQGYSWPGNVRELENVIGRAAVTSTGLTLQLPEGWKAEGSLTNRNTNLNSNAQVHSNPPVTNSNREATLGELEKAHILEVLHQTNWRIEGPKGAALILGLHPNTLRSRMNKLGIRRSANPRNLVVETTK